MFVYFIKAFGESDLIRIKIGSSKNPQNRLKDLQIGSPVKLKLMGMVKCKSALHAQQVERLAHRLFYKQRRRGEWFRLSVKRIAMLERLIQTVADKHAEIEEDCLAPVLPSFKEADDFLNTLSCKIDPYT